MLELGIITDEIHDDVARGAALAAQWGLQALELRTVGGRNLLQLDDDALDGVERAVRASGLPVCAIASPVFKAPRDGRPRAVAADFALPGSEGLDAQLALLERACALARRFGAPLVRVFTFWREAADAAGPVDDATLRDIAGKLERAAAVARRHDVVLGVENEPVCIVGSGAQLGQLCAAVGERVPAELRRHLGALWDPGNALVAGEVRPYPDGYGALRACDVRHVHLKDVRPGADGAAARFVPLGQGEVAYEGQLDALLRDGYRGAFVLEPHVEPVDGSRVDGARACALAARAMLDAARARTGI